MNKVNKEIKNQSERVNAAAAFEDIHITTASRITFLKQEKQS